MDDTLLATNVFRVDGGFCSQHKTIMESVHANNLSEEIFRSDETCFNNFMRRCAAINSALGIVTALTGKTLALEVRSDTETVLSSCRRRM